jgi:hypothetical protein
VLPSGSQWGWPASRVRSALSSLQAQQPGPRGVLVMCKISLPNCEQGAAELAQAEGEPEAAGGPSLSGLSVITERFSTPVVRAFLGEAYCCSGVVRAPPGEGGLATWNALGPEGQQEAVRLADMLNAEGVLGCWDAMVAEEVGRHGLTVGGLSSDSLIRLLLLADRFQEQLPRAYEACMVKTCALVSEGNEGVIRAVPDLSPASSALLLKEVRSSLAAAISAGSQALANEVAAHAASVATWAESIGKMQQAVQWAAAAQQWVADADLRAVSAGGCWPCRFLLKMRSRLTRFCRLIAPAVIGRTMTLF